MDITLVEYLTFKGSRTFHFLLVSESEARDLLPCVSFPGKEGECVERREAQSLLSESPAQLVYSAVHLKVTFNSF